jgi:hypothetical protein
MALLVLGSSSRVAAAQDAPAVRNEATTEIAGRLRSFYFNLASNSWEPLTSDILAAKVVAHRPFPQTLLAAARPAGAGLSLVERPCSSDRSVSVEQAVIAVEGDWAEARVPQCGPVPQHDEFRLIRFAGRWRFVSIHLSQHSPSVTVQR